jgi:putative DNA primase/helicase
MMANYKLESDSVASFVEDEGYFRSVSSWTSLKNLYEIYREYCKNNGLYPVNAKNLVKRLAALGFDSEKKAIGKVIFIDK